MSTRCRICDGNVDVLVDLGRQPRANHFLRESEVDHEILFRLAVGMCDSCTTAQLIESIPPQLRYHDDYAYQASGSMSHRAHFEGNARYFLDHHLAGPDPFIVEIGCNDGVMLATIARAGVRHLGVDPSSNVAGIAAAKGVQVRTEFFDEETALAVRAEHGPADVVFGANTICHIDDLASVLRGVAALLAPGGVFVFEEPYLGTIVERNAFDQIYDEHVYYFTARSVQAIAPLLGLELIAAERIAMHGGELRYTLALPGARAVSPDLDELLAEERTLGLAEPATLRRFAGTIAATRTELRALLQDLTARGARVVGYGAPGKATTSTNYFGIGPDLLPYVCDSTEVKQGRLVPGSHLPVVSPEKFSADLPDYALLFAWNHAEEILRKEAAFREAGGRFITYVPTVTVT